MTPLALRMCRSANGVSLKHGEVSRDLWAGMFPDASNWKAVPIAHVTNGVHAPTWVARLFQDLYRDSINDDWDRLVTDGEAWAAALRRLADAGVGSPHP